MISGNTFCRACWGIETRRAPITSRTPVAPRGYVSLRAQQPAAAPAPRQRSQRLNDDEGEAAAGLAALQDQGGEEAEQPPVEAAAGPQHEDEASMTPKFVKALRDEVRGRM